MAVGERILLTLWVGAMWTVGYLAAPILFNTLDSRMLAGLLAGKMFTVVDIIGLVAGTMLLLGALYRAGRRASRDSRVWMLAVMLLLVAIQQFYFQPVMEALKANGLAEGSAAAAEFARMHGAASILYLINSLLGLVLVARPPCGHVVREG